MTLAGRDAPASRNLTLRPESARFASFNIQDLLRAAVFLAAYVALEWVSFIHEYQGVPITPWNPGLGAVFALMLVRGARFAAVLFLGVIFAEVAVLRSTLEWDAILAIAAIIAGVYGAAAWLTRRKFALDIAITRLRELSVLLAVSIGAAVLVGLLLSLLLLLEGELAPTDVFLASGPLLVGDAIGIAVTTPLTLRFVLGSRGLPPPSPRILFEIGAYVTAVALSLTIVGADSTDGVRYFYLLFVPVVIAALRYGLDGTCLILAFTQLGLVSVMHAQGYDAGTFTEFQVLMLVLTTTGLIVGVVVSERESANRLARDADRRFKEMQAEAARATRFNLVSGMGSALAHEINQPMTAARALARSAEHLIAGPKPDLSRAGANLAAAVVQIDHAAAVVRRMREFLRRGRPHVTTLDMAAVLQDAILLVHGDLEGHGIRIEIHVPADLPPLHGDRVQLQQVVLNLVRNAIDALAGMQTPDAAITILARKEDERHVMISVRDNGPGIDPSVVDRLFGPLTTSKKEGLGLGLAISQSIVEAHGGRVWLHEYRPGATEFRISLPLETQEI